jgi:hypothetical protein
MFGINLDSLVSTLQVEMNKFHTALADIRKEMQGIRKELKEIKADVRKQFIDGY